MSLTDFKETFTLSSSFAPPKRNLHQSRWKPRQNECCYKWGWKEQVVKSSLWMPRKVLPFSFFLSQIINQLGSIEFSLSLTLSFPLPFSLIFSEFPCGWCSNVDLKLLLWIVLQKANKPQEGRLGLKDLASTSKCIFLPWGEGEAWGGFFQYHLLLLGFIS